MSTSSAITKRWATWSSILLIIVGLAFGVKMLPSGYSTDLNAVGNGQNAGVLVHSKESARSLDLMGAVDAARADYEGRIAFIVADVDTPQGASFSQAQMVGEGTLVLFDGSGNRLKHLVGIRNPVDLKNALNQALSSAQ